MAYAFEGYTTAEFRSGSYSCAGGLPMDVIGYLPSFLPNTTQLQVTFCHAVAWSLRPTPTCARYTSPIRVQPSLKARSQVYPACIMAQQMAHHLEATARAR